MSFQPIRCRNPSPTPRAPCDDRESPREQNGDESTSSSKASGIWRLSSSIECVMSNINDQLVSLAHRLEREPLKDLSVSTGPTKKWDGSSNSSRNNVENQLPVSPKQLIAEFHTTTCSLLSRSPLQVVDFTNVRHPLKQTTPKRSQQHRTKTTSSITKCSNSTTTGGGNENECSVKKTSNSSDATKPRTTTMSSTRAPVKSKGPCRDPSGTCPKEARVKGLCWTHYTHQLRLSKIDPNLDPSDPSTHCIENGCEKPKRVKERCWSHYTRELKQRKLKQQQKNPSPSAKCCRVYGCQTVATPTGFCSVHQPSSRKPSTPELPHQQKQPQSSFENDASVCRIDNCERRAMIGSVCLFHSPTSSHPTPAETMV